MPISCAGCTATWTGRTVAHCSGCHQTFASVGSFDRHRRAFTCLAPPDAGLTLGTRGHWTRADVININES